MQPPPKRSLSGLRRAALVVLSAAGVRWAQGADPETPLNGTSELGSTLDQAFFLQLGFSFMVGLAAGFALKIAFKIALLMIGVILVGVFALQYAGLAEVDWSGVELQYDTGADWVGTQGEALLDFIGRNLPSAGSFLAGLALGLKL